MSELELVIGLIIVTALIVCRIENSTLRKTINRLDDRAQTTRKRNIALNLEITKLQLENYGLRVRYNKPTLGRRLHYLFTGKLT